MRPAQKFLCYSLTLVGAALIFSVGCKKTTTAGNNTVAGQLPVLIVGGLTVTATGGSSATLVAGDFIQNIGSSSLVQVGFTYTATAVTYTGGTTPTCKQAVTATIPQGLAGTGAFTASLSITQALIHGLSGTIGNNLTWVVWSYATNGTGTIVSALSATITTTN